MARSRVQRGQLTVYGKGDRAYWSGRFWVRVLNGAGQEVAERRHAFIGLCSAMDRAKARTVLVHKIQEAQAEAKRIHIVSSAVTSTASTPRYARGSLAELLVASDLMMKSMEVFRNLNPQGSCDLIATDGKNCFRVEVKYAGLVKGKPAPRFVKTSGCKFDILAVVSTDHAISYFDSKGHPLSLPTLPEEPQIAVVS